MILKSSVFILNKGLKKPKTAGERSIDAMLTAGDTPSSLKEPQAKGGVKCPQCGHHHRSPSVCSYTTKSLKALLVQGIRMSKANETVAGKVAAKKQTKQDEKKTGNLKTGVPGHKGGNPYHDEKGRFTTEDKAVSATTGKGEGAVSVDKDDPIAGSGEGSDKAQDSEFNPSQHEKNKQALLSGNATKDQAEQYLKHAKNQKYRNLGAEARAQSLIERKQSTENGSGTPDPDDHIAQQKAAYEAGQREYAERQKQQAGVADTKKLQADKPAASDALKEFLERNKRQKEAQGQQSLSPEEAKARRERAEEAGADEKYQNILQQRMEQDPERFAGGNLQPRDLREPQRPQGPSDVTSPASGEDPLDSGDAYEQARQQSAQRFQQDAINQAREAGADPVSAAEAGQRAWQQHFEAYNAARAQGIPVEQVEAQIGQLGSDVTQPMRPGQLGSPPIPVGSDPQMTQPMRPGQLGPPPAPVTPPTTPAETIQPDTASTAASKQEDQNWKENQKIVGREVSRRAKKAGLDVMQQKILQRKAENAVAEARAAGVSDKDLMEHLRSNEELSEFLTPEDTTKKPKIPKFPQGTRPPTTRTGSFTTPFSQYYGSGAAMGSGGVAGQGASLAPTGAFAAQRAHELLNTDLSPLSSRTSTMTHPGTVSNKYRSSPKPTQSALQQTTKSLKDWLLWKTS